MSRAVQPKVRLPDLQVRVLISLFGSCKVNKLHNCHTQAEGLGQSHGPSVTVGSEPMNSHELRSEVTVEPTTLKKAGEGDTAVPPTQSDPMDTYCARSLL